jgi:hypothetical protein
MVGIGSGKFLGRRRVGREFEEFRRVDRVFQTFQSMLAVAQRLEMGLWLLGANLLRYPVDYLLFE